MQLQRVLALAAAALMGCALSTAAALDFSDATSTATTTDSDDGDESRTPNDEDRIYGGSEADASKYPFTVSLRKTAEGTTYCGGTLVAAQYIVTAAHCVKNTTYASIGSQYAVGSKDGERIKVVEAYTHPKYVKDTHDYDVAVMKLETPSTYTTLPLCKADGSQNKENSMAVVRGWGMTESNVAASTLLEVNLKIISNAVCNKSYDNRITERMICAGDGGGKDSCQGDSGGALISNNVLVGIVSWGGACGVAPGVYVRVTSVLDFINEKIGGGSSTPTAAPAATTVAPASTTAAPAATTDAPSTDAPDATTDAPAATTDAPDATTDAPAATTDVPAATTATPVTDAPATTTPAPTAASDASSSGGSGASVTPKPKKKKDCGVRL